ncbi:MAG: HEAT repeat domain-containing protein [Acidobacteriia bacterium]|nr:HEAT repeat domain-containing protein [Terriglobia bacterium]
MWCAHRVGLAGVLVFVFVANSQDRPLFSAARQNSSAKGQATAGKVQTPASSNTAADLPAQAWKMLAEGAASPKVIQRTDAISAVATIGPQPGVLEILETALHDKEPDVRQVAAASCGELKSKNLIPALKQTLNDKSPDVSFAAARALWDMGDRSGRDVFIAVLAGERTSSKLSGELTDARRRLRNPMSLALIGAEQGAGALLGPFSIGISIAEELAKDSSVQARALSANLLGADDSAVSLEELQKALADKNWVVRAAAAKSLGHSSQPSFISKLQPLLKDDKEPVRFMAAASIVRLSSQPVSHSHALTGRSSHRASRGSR